MIVVRAWGIGGSVVGGGHPGRAWLGQARGGAVDLQSLALANRLVGNQERDAAIETSGGMEIELRRAAMVAVAGAVAQWTVSGGPPLGWGVPVVLPAGSRVRGGRLLAGARSYLAVRGGLKATGADVLTIGIDPGAPAAQHPAARRSLPSTIRVSPGPRRDWFAASAWDALVGEPYEVTSTNRVGTRLLGTPLTRRRHDELPSEGVIEGALQVPPDGQPIIMLADHPTTGGYPVIAVVDPGDVAAVAQAAPGSILRFVVAGRPR